MLLCMRIFIGTTALYDFSVLKSLLILSWFPAIWYRPSLVSREIGNRCAIEVE